MKTKLLTTLFILLVTGLFAQSSERVFFDQAAISFYKKDYNTANDQVESGLKQHPNSTILLELKIKILAKIKIEDAQSKNQPIKNTANQNSKKELIQKNTNNQDIQQTENSISKPIELKIGLKEVGTNQFKWNEDLKNQAEKITLIIKNWSGSLEIDVTGKSQYQFNPGDPKWDGYKASVELIAEVPANVKIIDSPKITVYTSCSN